MRKVLVIGSSGAGKSVFAARLAERTGLPLIHLDAIYWKPGWVPTPKDEWTRIVEGLLARDAWVMGGQLRGHAGPPPGRIHRNRAVAIDCNPL